MNSINPPVIGKPAPLLGFASVALLCVPLLLLLGAIGVTSYFRLSSDASALRQSVIGEVNGGWQKKFAIHVGPLTTGVIRLCSHWVRLTPEPKAALEAIHGAEVGIYKFHGETVTLDAGTILARADKVMATRGWQRAIGVSKEQELVAIYLPKREFSPEDLKCCLMVCHNHELVVVSAQGNLEPLFEIASREIDLNRPLSTFALK